MAEKPLFGFQVESHLIGWVDLRVIQRMYVEIYMSDRQNAIQQNPVYSRKASVLGVRCIGLHGLVCHAVTFACWFGLKPWG